MANKSNDTGYLIIQCSGVRLVRFGAFGRPDTRYEVQEPDHVAGFSRGHFRHPLTAAVDFLLHQANRRYFSGAPFPKTLRKEPS